MFTCFIEISSNRGWDQGNVEELVKTGLCDERSTPSDEQMKVDSRERA